MTGNEGNEQAQPDQTVMFQIVINKDGNVGIAGPILADKTACYGLIETAKDILRDMHKPTLVKPNGKVIDFIRNGGKH